jgi:formate dehydrogenase iron-sulfur subunit
VTTAPLPMPTFGGGYAEGEERPRMGFFTDTSVCIGCKACEVACKEWNMVPGSPLDWTGASYDNTMELGADNWRHVAFVEQDAPRRRGAGAGVADGPPGVTEGPPPWVTEGPPGVTEGPPGVTEGAGPVADLAAGAGDGAAGIRWLMSSDVCKHCTSAACLEVCPTGALFRTEFGTVVVQEDVCNGCGYCVPACPFGVIGRREDDGRAFKCTLCYDRLKGGMEPACAHACPTDSIQFGPVEELRQRAAGRLGDLRQQGVDEARLYLSGSNDGIGGAGAFFLLLDDPEVYGLPPDPVSTTRDLPGMWRAAAVAAGALAAGIAAAFLGGRR